MFLYNTIFFFSKTCTLFKKNKNVSGQRSLYFGHGNLLKGYGEVMEKSLKVIERAHTKPRYLTRYLNWCKNAKRLLQNPRCVFEDVYKSRFSEQLSITVPSIGLES